MAVLAGGEPAADRGAESTNEVRYHLNEDGTILVADESFRGPEQRYDNRWVFARG